MNPETIVEKARNTGVKLWRNGEKIRYRGEESAVMELLPDLREHKAGLLQILSATHPDPENIIEYTEERAAILEYDAGMPRTEAEKEAVRRAIMKFRLVENEGGGTLIGAQGDTLQDLRDALKRRYGDRLKWTKS